MITVYGSSDDLIEIDGDIYEEFGYYSNDSALLAFSDGTILRIKFDLNGIWRIVPVVNGSAHLNIVQAPENSDVIYSDIATLNGDISWVVLGSQMATCR